jgi:hypothetical protein
MSDSMPTPSSAEEAVKLAREALAFYATGSHIDHDPGDFAASPSVEAGDRAKEALAALDRFTSAPSVPVPAPMTSDEWWQGMDEAVTALRYAAKTFAADRTTAAQEVMENAAKRIDRIRWHAFETYIRTTPDKERQLSPTPEQPLCDKDKATLTRWALQIERLAPLFSDERAQMCRLVESLIMTVVACTKTETKEV